MLESALEILFYDLIEEGFIYDEDENDICDVKLLLGFKDNKPINGVINMHVENEKPSYEFQYEF